MRASSVYSLPVMSQHRSCMSSFYASPTSHAFCFFSTGRQSLKPIDAGTVSFFSAVTPTPGSRAKSIRTLCLSSDLQSSVPSSTTVALGGCSRRIRAARLIYMILYVQRRLQMKSTSDSAHSQMSEDKVMRKAKAPSWSRLKESNQTSSSRKR